MDMVLFNSIFENQNQFVETYFVGVSFCLSTHKNVH